MGEQKNGARKTEPRTNSDFGLVAIPSTTTTAAATAAATVTATATAAAAAAARTLFAGSGDIDCEGAAIHCGAIHGLDGFLGLLGCAHGDEGEPARASAHLIHHQVGFQDRAMRGKRVLQVVFCGVEGEISYKQFITHAILTVRLATAFRDCSRLSGLKSPLNQVHLRFSMP